MLCPIDIVCNLFFTNHISKSSSFNLCSNPLKTLHDSWSVGQPIVGLFCPLDKHPCLSFFYTYILYTHTCIHMYIYFHTHIYIYVYTYIFIYILYTRICICIYIYICIYKYIYMYIYTHICICIHISSWPLESYLCTSRSMCVCVGVNTHTQIYS